MTMRLVTLTLRLFNSLGYCFTTDTNTFFFSNNPKYSTPEIAEAWNKLTQEEQDNREAWYVLTRGPYKLDKLGPLDNTWDEFPAYALSNPLMMRQLSEVASPLPSRSGKKVSLAGRLIEAVLKFAGLKQSSEFPQSVIDDIVDIETRYTQGLSKRTFNQHVDQSIRESVVKDMARGLSDKDKALLAARKKARGGLSQVDFWANRRNIGQAIHADHKYYAGVKKGVPKDRWNITGAFDGLSAMNQEQLEKVSEELQAKIELMREEGYTETNNQLMYYIARQIGAVQAQDKLRIQEHKTRALEWQAIEKAEPETPLQKRAYYKKKYKDAIKKDLPYSKVVKIRDKLIELMGDRFYSWSKETPPHPIGAEARKEIIEQTPINQEFKPTQTFTSEQIATALDEAGLPTSTKYREVDIDPKTYLALTTGSNKRLGTIMETSAKTFDQKEMDTSSAPLLVVDKDGTVIAHDGRHRAATHVYSNKPTMPILLLGNTNPTKVFAQKFGSKQRSTEFVPQDKVPVPKAIKEKKPDTYIDPKTGVKVTVLPPHTAADAAKNQKGVVDEEARAVPEKKDVATKYKKTIGVLRDTFIAQGIPVSPDLESEIANVIISAHTYNIISKRTS